MSDLDEEKKEDTTFNPARNCAPNYEAHAFTEHQNLLWISQDRISKFLDHKEQWKDVNISQEKWYYEYYDINIQSYSPTFKLRPLFNEVMKVAKFKPTKIGIFYK